MEAHAMNQVSYNAGEVMNMNENQDRVQVGNVHSHVNENARHNHHASKISDDDQECSMGSFSSSHGTHTNTQVVNVDMDVNGAEGLGQRAPKANVMIPVSTSQCQNDVNASNLKPPPSDVDHNKNNVNEHANLNVHVAKDGGDGGDDSDSDIEVVAVTPGKTSQSQPQPQPQPRPIQPSPQLHYHHHQQQQQQHQQQQHQQMQHYQHGQHQMQHHNHHQQQQQYQNQQMQQPQTINYRGYMVKPNCVYHCKAEMKDHVSTWQDIMPKATARIRRDAASQNQIHAYKLSLLSNKEFTIHPVQHESNSIYFEPTLNGFRRTIKDITRKHGNAGEKAILDEGRWRIPLSVYYAFVSYLSQEPNTVVHRIPEAQLNIASLGRAAAARGYPTPEELMDKHGVPRGLSMRLAPYQRGGVDFVMQRAGRALIADEMGLGKTVQGIASMTCFENEWPLLVLSPSSARYHWEAEFMQWLGEESSINVEARAMEEQELEEQAQNELHDGATLEFGEEKKADPSDLLDMNGDGSSSKRRRGDDHDGPPRGRSRRRRRNTMRLMHRHEINVLGSSNEGLLTSPNTRVVIISYGLIPNLVRKGLLFPGQFKCCIVDESHMLKNKKSKRTMSVMPLLQQAKRVVMLSGTPALSKPAELFPQLHALGAQNGWWDDEEDFMSNYVKDKYSDPSFAELHALLTSTVMIRRMKNDILKDLPSKVRESVHVNVRCERLKTDIKGGLLALREGKGVLGKLSVLYQADLNSSSGNEPGETQNSLDNNGINILDNPPNAFGGDERKNRKAVLNQVFRMTGDAKIPILVDMLKRWIENPTNGKICIFAHHISVLNGIMYGAGLSNAYNSPSKFIRIDGSTLPKARQDQITSFQNDPSVRIALLGITAAGVGVTLTAASTIWFAELFWTPAIMIQAEDRCHRIGQQAKVRCLYTIARGTLDEVLWILLKRKFRSLGEFVEGKEMMDIVVHNSFNNEFDAVERKSENDDGSDSEIENEDLANEDRIQNDLEELAMEEQLAAKGLVGEDEDLLDDDANFSNAVKKNGNRGQSQENIICLLDDDEDPTPTEPEDLSIDEVCKKYAEGPNLNFVIKPTTKMPNMTLFQVFFPGPKYGLGFDTAFGRVFIENTEQETFQRGDVLVGVENILLQPNSSFGQVIQYMRNLLCNPPIRLVFGRDPDLAKMYVHYKTLKHEAMRLKQQSQLALQEKNETPKQAPPFKSDERTANSTTERQSDEVIELLDD